MGMERPFLNIWKLQYVESIIRPFVSFIPYDWFGPICDVSMLSSSNQPTLPHHSAKAPFIKQSFDHFSCIHLPINGTWATKQFRRSQRVIIDIVDNISTQSLFQRCTAPSEQWQWWFIGSTDIIHDGYCMSTGACKDTFYVLFWSEEWRNTREDGTPHQGAFTLTISSKFARDTWHLIRDWIEFHRYQCSFSRHSNLGWDYRGSRIRMEQSVTRIQSSLGRNGGGRS